MRFASTLAALAIAATALGACGTSSAPSATPVPPTSAPSPAPTQIPGGGDDVTRALDGRSFTGTTINGHDLADVTKVRLAFKGLGINGSGGCNSMSGPYAVTAGILQVGAIGITEAVKAAQKVYRWVLCCCSLRALPLCAGAID